MMENQVDLTIIIPFYNGEKFISQLLISIETSYLTARTHVIKLEIIILIDSVETCHASIEKIVNLNPAISVVIVKNEKNIGVAKTRNLGIDLAKGKYIHFIDQDDEILPLFFSALINRKYQQYDLILINGVFVKNKKRLCKIFYLEPSLTIKNLIQDDFIRSPGQVVIKKNLLGSNIRFPSPKCHFGSDDKFFYITLFKSQSPKYLYINSPLYQANIHENNYSNDVKESMLSSLELFKHIEATTELNRFEKRYVRKTKLMLLHTLKMSKGLEKAQGLLHYLEYKLRINKVVRYCVKFMNSAI